jgi:hypothetical protein
MNGGGKSGLVADPTGEADFVGRIGDSVEIVVASDRPGAVMLAAIYADQELGVSFEGRTRFVVASGIATLSFHIEASEVADTLSAVISQVDDRGGQHPLASIRGGKIMTVTYTIRGTQ